MKRRQPEFCRVLLRHPVVISAIDAAWKHGLQFRQHVAENKTQLRQASSVGRRFVVDLVLCILEEPDRLLALVHEVFHEQPEVLVVVQERQIVFILFEDGAKMLVGVGKNIKYERWTVFQIHTPVRALIDHLVHQLPCLLDRLLVKRWLGLFGGSRLCQFLCQVFEPTSSSLASHA